VAGTVGVNRQERVYMNSWDLAGARSINTSVFLQNQGVAPDLLQAVSYGSYRPLSDEGDLGTPESEAHNRRMDIVILTFKSTRRESGQSGFRLPRTTIPGSEELLPDTLGAE